MKRLTNFLLNCIWLYPLDTNVEIALKMFIFKKEQINNDRYFNDYDKTINNSGFNPKLITSFRGRSKVSEKISMRVK